MSHANAKYKKKIKTKTFNSAAAVLRSQKFLPGENANNRCNGNEKYQTVICNFKSKDFFFKFIYFLSHCCAIDERKCMFGIFKVSRILKRHFRKKRRQMWQGIVILIFLGTTSSLRKRAGFFFG